MPVPITGHTLVTPFDGTHDIVESHAIVMHVDRSAFESRQMRRAVDCKSRSLRLPGVTHLEAVTSGGQVVQQKVHNLTQRHTIS